MGNFFQREFSKVFTVIPNLLTDFFPRVIQTFARRDTYIERSLEIYQSIRTLVLSKNTGIEKRKYFENFLLLFNQHGFSIRLYRNTPPNYTPIKFEKRGGKDGFVHYESLQEYIAANTQVDALSFYKLDYLFRIYFVLVSAILLINLLHYFVVKIAVKLVIHQIRNLVLFCNFIYTWSDFY